MSEQEIGMWLVIVRTTMDDLPIQLCDSYAEAREVADWITQAQCDEATDLMEVDSAGLVCPAIVHFNEDGKPVKLDILEGAL